MKEQELSTREHEPQIKSQNLTRVSMNLNQRSIDNVEKLSKMLGEPNKTRVVSTALEITKAMMEYLANGNEIIIRYPDKSEKSLELIIG